MDNTSLGQTTLEHMPSEFLHPKRKTNRLWTFLIIVIVMTLFGAFWLYKRGIIMNTTPEVVPVSSAPKNDFSDMESELANTTISDYHEML